MNLKKSLAVVLSLLLVMMTTVSVFAESAESASDTNEVKTSKNAQKEKDIKLDARNAIVYCENTGEIIYTKNIHERVEPFSITKLMTALLAIQNLPLDKEVEVPREATLIGESTMGLIEGEKVTVKDLLYGAMLHSGNDACYTLAVAVSGSEKKFVKLMNKTARNIGCKDTNFANPHGMRDKKHYTTAYDMMLISKLAFSNDVLAKISGSKVYKMGKTNKSKARTMNTHISVIEDDKNNIMCAKTGTWDENNCGISVFYEKNGLKLVALIMGAKTATREKDILNLVNSISSKVEGVKVVDKGVEQGKVRIKHGAKTRLEAYTKDIGYAFIPKEASKSLIQTQVVLKNDVTAPVKKGTVVGALEIYAADDLVNRVDLIVKENVEEGWFPSYVGISNAATMVICGVFALLIVLYIWIQVEKAKARRRRARRRREKIERMAVEQLLEEQSRKEREWRF
ncbi:MAG: D-alanyl-D-alanine carboxypeptidase [Eubacteriaceae bacterium]|nr:D-alanyl-D-alanine carboxypeptidase [Eubacteriaceae bacterium]